MNPFQKNIFVLFSILTVSGTGAFAQELSPEITKQASELRSIDAEKAVVEKEYQSAKYLRSKASDELFLAKTKVFDLKVAKKLKLKVKEIGDQSIDEAIEKAKEEVVKKQAELDFAKERFEPVSDQYQDLRRRSRFSEKTLKAMVNEHYINHCDQKNLRQQVLEQLGNALAKLENSQNSTEVKDKIKIDLILKSGECRKDKIEVRELREYIQLEDVTGDDDSENSIKGQ